MAGSVSVGKSTTARLLRLLLARWPQHPRVELVTTDGFLLPNAELAAPRVDGPQGLPRVLRPARAAALRHRGQGRPGRGARAGVLAPGLRHRARRAADRAPPGHPAAGGAQRAAARPAGRAAAGAGGQRLHRLLGLRGRGHRGHPALVRRAVPAAAGDRVPRPRVVLPPLRRAGRGRRGRARREHLGGDQRAEPGAQHLPTRGRATLVLRKGPAHSVTGIRLRKV